MILLQITNAFLLDDVNMHVYEHEYTFDAAFDFFSHKMINI